MKLVTMCVIPALLLIGSGVTEVQTTPDFSGTWTLVDYRVGDKVAPSQNVMVSGAALNCGHRCTITQTAEALTVSRTPTSAGEKPRDEVVFLDGRAMTNQKTASWDGTSLRISQTFMNIVVTQTLTLQQGKLVVSSTVVPGKTGPYTLTYERVTDRH